jgi:hypothetical protein
MIGDEPLFFHDDCACWDCVLRLHAWAAKTAAERRARVEVLTGR